MNPRAVVINPVDSMRILVVAAANLKADSLFTDGMVLVHIAIPRTISSPSRRE